MGYQKKNVLVLENGQEVLFSKQGFRMGKKVETKNVYVDQVSGEEIEGFVLRDRERLAKDGVIILMMEINAATGQLANRADIIARGFNPNDNKIVIDLLNNELQLLLSKKKGKVTNWMHLRKQVEEVSSKLIYKKLRRRPLVLPVIIEV